MKRSRNRTYPEVTTDVASLSHEGRGIAVIQDKTTFIHGALAGEKVICKITKYHRRFNEAKIIKIIEPSPLRTNPTCAHFGICGGCSMQHMKVEHQIQLKQNTLLEQLKHFGQVEPEILLAPISGSHTWGYRGKARLGVRYVIKKSKLLVGFRETSSNYLADIETCHVLHSSIGKRMQVLRELIANLNQFDQIPQVEVAVGDNTTALIFRHMTNLPEEDIEKIRQFGEQYQFHIYLQPNPPDPVRLIWPITNIQLSYTLPDFDLEMLFSPLDFTQVNTEINRLMIKQALALLELKSTDHVLDLFCGLGNFTLPIARFAEYVVGVEGNEAMVKQAKINAIHNNINNTEFYSANLMQPVATDEWLQKKYHKILLDPSRQGAKEIIPFLPRISPEKIVYVSCNPATLARDAKELVHTFGYRLKKSGVINMFPHTSHIEAIALFEK